MGAAQSFTSARVRGEVAARSAAGEGAWPQDSARRLSPLIIAMLRIAFLPGRTAAEGRLCLLPARGEKEVRAARKNAFFLRPRAAGEGNRACRTTMRRPTSRIDFQI